ncbi:hypothetical protein T069G_08451 [Trichoderma breve]|uniref:Uncharacterized protein n=1 Tax=Trichoderma breve TaxID=2034170 RepID=A0A9W9E474_9HYPO|nr:hypothetical protein T069G_08451 [Trichoderma breve]KAJ4857554.1 hypothetical protein T069G_08451 [Trichoderma breve]
MVQLSHRPGSNKLRLTTVLCLLAVLPFTLASGVDPRPAIGFDLGQSYGTAVAHLPNGTIVKLAKIEGSPRYRAFMQSELEKQKDYLDWYEERTRSSLLWEEILILLNRYTGFGPTYGGTILAEMLRSLRIASEATLGAPLPATVVFTAPYVRAWQHEEALLDGLLQRARILAGLKPVTIENMDPVYLGETNTVLAANRRRICPNLRCFGPSIFDEPPWAYETEPLRTDQVVYFVSFTYHSLYTSFQLATSKSTQATRKAFGVSLKITLYPKLKSEAADNPKFMDAVRQAITRIQNDPIHRYKEAMTGPKVELLVSQDLTYAAAAGVALWRRSMIDSSYCENVARMNKKDHDEL